MVLAQRMQQNASGVAGHGGGNLPSETHQGAQISGAGGTHNSGKPHGQESERSTAENNVHPGNDQSMHQSNSTNRENTARQNGASLAISAAGAFDAAKDIMEALRSKHNNLASELEVICFLFVYNR